MQLDSRKISFAIALSLHILVIGLLFVSFKTTVKPLSSAAQVVEKKIINAVMIDDGSLKSEIARLDNLDKQALEKKRMEAKQQEQQKEQELAKLENIKQEKSKLEQELTQKKLAQEKLLLEQAKELKQKQEDLAKLEKQKAAVLKAKEQAELQAAQLAKQQELKKHEAHARAEAEAKAKQQAELAKISAEQQLVVRNQIARYSGIIKEKIHQNWRQPLGLALAGVSCKIAVKLATNGQVLEVKIIESSGSLEFDRSSELAVKKSSPLPLPHDQEIAKNFYSFTFTFKPESA